MRIRRLMLALLLAHVWFLGAAPHLAAAQSPPGVAKTQEDRQLADRVQAALIESNRVQAADVQVDSARGVVQLSGFVDSREQAEAAVAVARRVPGVRQVKSALQVKTGL